MISVNRRFAVIAVVGFIIGLGIGSQAFPRIAPQLTTQTVTAGATATTTILNACPVTPFSSQRPPAVGLDPTYASLPAQWYRNENGTLWAFGFNSTRPPHAGSGDGLKVLWVRTDGGTFERHQLVIEGVQLGGQSAPMNTTIPTGYAGNYQPSGLFFPTEGCWNVTGIVDGNTLSFVVYVYP